MRHARICRRSQVDVHLTSDGAIAVLHDEDVGRVTEEGKGLISSLTWAQARSLTLKNSGGRIPSLEEVRGDCTLMSYKSYSHTCNSPPPDRPHPGPTSPP